MWYTKIMDDAKEEIRARLSVEDVVGQYIELKRAGRNLKGRSPWGVDKTPSFMVSPDKGIWHDFSANKGGDIFSFIMEVEGISFREALEKLAAQAGVELQRYSGGDRKVAERKRRLKEILELSCRYYQFCLTKNEKVCDYVFHKRNLTKPTVQEFRIGYSPNQGKALVQFLTKKGYKLKEMEAAGVLNQYKGDLFRGRMMVPFIDVVGVIGYTARILGKGEPKYLNTPETLLFNKSRFVFGLVQAKEAIRQNGFVVIVEGNMDVISSHQAGVKEAVATSGTAMTEGHLKMLSRLTGDVRLAYDGDAAGVKATERAIMLAGDLGINLSVISDYHGAKDPDELIQKDPKLWQEAVKNYRPAVDWLLDKYEENLDLNSGPGKREYADLAMKLLKNVSHPVEKTHYEQLVARKLDCSVEDLRAQNVAQTPSKRLKKANLEAASDVLAGIRDNLQAIVIYGGVSGIKGVELPDEETRLEELEMVFEARYKEWDKAALEKEAKALLVRYKTEMGKQEVEMLNVELAKAEEVGDEDKQAEILRKIMVLRRAG
jgi:DNA primase